MKSILGIIVVGVLTLLLGWLLPWWSITIAGLIGGYTFGESAFKSFVITFLGGGLAWMILAFYIDQKNGSLLSEKIGLLFGNLPPSGLILVTALIAGLVSGFSGMSAYFARKTLE